MDDTEDEPSVDPTHTVLSGLVPPLPNTRTPWIFKIARSHPQLHITYIHTGIWVNDIIVTYDIAVIG